MMLQASSQAMLRDIVSNARNVRTQRTQLTNGSKTEKTPLVPDAPKPVDKAVIRRRWSFMYGAPGWYWSVSHPSLPAYFGHTLHLDSFDDAVEYANAVVRRDESAVA